MPAVSESDRRWLTLSLRSLMLVVALLCLTIATIGRRLRLARLQEEGRIEVIYKAGFAEWDYEYEHDEKCRDEQGQPDYVDPPQSLQSRLFGFGYCHDVVSISLGRKTRRQILDADIERFVRLLPELREVSLKFSQLSDAGLACLACEQNLERMQLYGTQISDDGLKYLNRLPRLKDLNVGRTKITVSGIARELRSVQLTSLWLSKDQIQSAVDGEKIERNMPGVTITEIFESEDGGVEFRGPIQLPSVDESTR